MELRKYIRKLFGTLLKQNKGSSIVIVIVAIAFVGILGATIMWMSLKNYQMKMTDARHKDSFYSAETVFEQITAGLQEDASAAANEAYVYVMQQYAKLNESERNYEFQTQYIDILQKRLVDAASPGKYDINKLLLYVNPDVMDTFGGTLTRVLRSTDCNMVNKSTYLVLENLELLYEDEAGFLARITTNLVISAPEGDFTQSASMPDVFDYCLIANQKLENPNAINSMTIKGNVYGGKDGMDIYNDMTIQNAKHIVTDGTITLQNFVDKDIEHPNVARPNVALHIGHADDEDIPSLWAENLLIKGGTVDLYSKTYIADDIKIMGVNTTLKLEQEYYGYGNSTSDEKKSSSIVINNINNTIDMSKLDKLLLAGHSYIGASNAKAVDPTTAGALTNPADIAGVNANTDILMGESIAVKGDQIAYLIPDECIGILDGEVVVGRNPMSGKDYEKLLQHQVDHPDTFVEVDFEKLLSVNDRTGSLRQYDSAGEFKKIFCPSNGETMVYYYMVMDPENANRYFQDFYGYRKEKLDRYFNIYATGGIKSNAFTRINVQGNFLTSEPAVDGTLLQTVSMNAALPEEEVQLTGECAKYTDTYSALKTKLITNNFKISATERTKSVFENIIKTSDLSTFCGSLGGTVNMSLNDASGVTAVITNSNYTYGSSSPEKTRLIISEGDVTVEKDFTGLILAKGKIDIKNGVSVISNVANGSATAKEELKQILQCKYSESKSPLVTTVETKPIELFVNGSSYVLDGTESTDDETKVVSNIDVTKLVRYEKWTKR